MTALILARIRAIPMIMEFVGIHQDILFSLLEDFLFYATLNPLKRLFDRFYSAIEFDYQHDLLNVISKVFVIVQISKIEY
jgi:hypothetical protein